MSVLYEVNLKVAQSVADEYLSWLHEHIQDMLTLAGFEEATLFEEKSNEEAAQFVVHYKITSREALEAYFQTDAARLRQEALTRFKDNFSATRRILCPIQSKEIV